MENSKKILIGAVILVVVILIILFSKSGKTEEPTTIEDPAIEEFMNSTFVMEEGLQQMYEDNPDFNPSW